MKRIKGLGFIVCFLLLSSICKAHKPELSSIMLIEQEPQNWIVQVRAALTACEYEVDTHFGKNAFATAEAFQDLLEQHVQENILIQFNGMKAATLQNGVVKLGHETSIIFQLSEVPRKINSLKIRNTSFASIARNQSALMVIKKDFEKDQFVLDNSNDHTANFKMLDTKFELLDESPKQRQKTLFIGAGLLAILILLIIRFKNRNLLS